MLLLTSDEGPAGIKRVISSARADAVILTDVGMDDDRVPIVREAGIDAVLIGVPADTAGLDCIDLDFAEAGRLCVQHLGELGHREVAFIGEAEGVYQRRAGFAIRTLAGITAGAAAWGMDLVHRPCAGSYEAVAGVLARILEERPRTTGLIVQNEAVIPPLLSLLRTAGRTVPEDVSIVAVCPDQIAVQTSPQLCSVNMPAAELGSGAVQMLMGRMNDGASTGSDPPAASAHRPRQHRTRQGEEPVNSIRDLGGALEWSAQQQTLRVEPWGPDAHQGPGRDRPGS